MASFTIAYVPNVENIDNIELVKRVDAVTEVSNVENLKNVEVVESVKLVDEVTTVGDVGTVHDVRQLPHPYFPMKKYNYQYGGMLHITPSQNSYQAIYLPPHDCEFKGLGICFTSYNIEDTYDVTIGSRYIIQGSHVKEMAEYRNLEVYEDVAAGTPIAITVHNKSGLEKFMMFEFVTLFDESMIAYQDQYTWEFDWADTEARIDEGDTCNLVINIPGYVNMSSQVESFVLDVTNTQTQLKIAEIHYNGNGSSGSTYIETDPTLIGAGFLARAGVIAITSITRFNKSIQIVFKNINSSGTLNNHPIEIGIKGVVANI